MVAARLTLPSMLTAELYDYRDYLRSFHNVPWEEAQDREFQAEQSGRPRVGVVLTFGASTITHWQADVDNLPWDDGERAELLDDLVADKLRDLWGLSTD